MIILVYGNVGSGKTASIIKDVVTKMNKMPTYSNVTMMKPVPNVIPIKAEMIINKEVIGQKKNGDEITKLTLNQQFWKDVPKPCNVILDEAHNLLNSRRSTSSVNVIMGDFIALLRRVLGESSYVGGDLILITQLERRIDVIAKEMAHQVRYYLCHYHKTCEDCGLDVKENSDTPEQMKYCYNCGGIKLKKSGFLIEAWHFKGNDLYINWKENGERTFHRHYFIQDIEEYFPYYDTIQWENMLSEFY